MSQSDDSKPDTNVLAHPTRPLDWTLLASLLFLCVGCLLRLIQYLGNASQWLDETMLSSSIVSRELPRLLTTPLAYGQSAPPGVLLMQRLAVVAFGPSDMTLRLFPFASSVVTLVACYGLIKLTLQGAARPVAMALIATAAPLIIYSGQAKQYSSDVAVAVVLLLIVVQTRRLELTRLRSGLLAGAGIVAVWVSTSAPFVLAGAALALLWPVLVNQSVGRQRWRLLTAIAAWGLASGLSLALARASVSAAVRQSLASYWSAGFMPMPPWRIAALAWPLQAFSRMFGGVESAGLWYPFSRCYAVLSVLGLWSLWRRDAQLGLLFVAPFLVTLLAAVAHQYPFRDRLVLFLLPSALLGVAEGVRFIAELLARRSRPLGLVAVVAFTAPPLYRAVQSLPPYGSEDIKPVLEHLRARLEPSDKVYVYYGAGTAFSYYASQYGIDRDGVLFGKCHYGDPRRHLEELDQLRGAARVWVLFTHALPVFNEPRDILAYLDATGTRRDALVDPPHQPAGSFAWLGSAELYLYDLSDPARLMLASAATFPVHGEHLQDPQFACN